MRFELDSPFKEVWSKAYFRVGKDGRSRLDLVNSKTDRTTISYARYLMSVKEGRFLTEDEEVDHINKDKTDDSISNLQILNIHEHKLKSISEIKPRKKIKLTCANCGIEFDRWHNQGLVYKKYVKSFCSRSCNGKFYNFGR